jgi:hypothetical protein
VNRKHHVVVKRPTKALDARGQLQGQDETIMADWPCSIEPLSGNKAAQARTLVPTVTHRLDGPGNPKKRFKEKDYIQVYGRRFDIEFINDKQMNGIELSLLCTEVILG